MAGVFEQEVPRAATEPQRKIVLCYHVCLRQSVFSTHADISGWFVAEDGIQFLIAPVTLCLAIKCGAESTTRRGRFAAAFAAPRLETVRWEALPVPGCCIVCNGSPPPRRPRAGGRQVWQLLVQLLTDRLDPRVDGT